MRRLPELMKGGYLVAQFTFSHKHFAAFSNQLVLWCVFNLVKTPIIQLSDAVRCRQIN